MEGQNKRDIRETVIKLLTGSKRFFRFEKFYEKVVKSVYEHFDDSKEVEVKMEILEVLADYTLSLYPEGVTSLFNEASPPVEDVNYLLVFNCSDAFYEKYSMAEETDVRKSTFLRLIDLVSTNKKKQDQKKLSALLQKSQPETILSSEIVPSELSEETKKYKTLMKAMFEDLDKYENMLIDLLIQKIVTAKIRKFLKNDEVIIEGKFYYYELEFEDFILLFFRIIKFITRLTIKFERPSEDKQLFVKLFGEEKVLNVIASHLSYELQLKNYAYSYAKYMYELKKTAKEDISRNDDSTFKLKSTIKEDEEKSLIAKASNDMYPELQFYELNIDDPINFPPYIECEQHKYNKYRRYEKNDLFHYCSHDPDFKDDEIESKKLYQQKTTEEHHEATTECCSIFRNIDKLRIIHQIIDHFIKIKTLSDNDLLVNITMSRNFISYGELLSTKNLLWSSFNIFNSHEQSKYINLIRNFYGEKISFYYLWLVFFNMWLIFPAILGIILWVISLTMNGILVKSNVQGFKELKFTFYDISLFIFCLLITFWATAFIKIWRQKEKLYSYLWGMESYETNEPNQEGFEPEVQMPFIFGEKLSIGSKLKKSLKTIVTYFVIIVLIIINAILVYLIFKFKAYKTNNGKKNVMEWSIILAFGNAIMVKIMSILYDFVARRLTIWENHEKYSQSENAIALKLIMFEFMNKYFSLYYIAFIKPYQYQSCMNNNCLKEISIQLYAIVLMKFIFHGLEILIHQLKLKWKKRKLIKSLRKKVPNFNEDEFEIIPHSHEHQMLCDELNTLIFYYNEQIITFGYVCFFSVAAPLTPFIIFVLIYFEKFSDGYRMFYHNRVSIIDGASGIGIYDKVLKVFYFIGMLTNIALVLFTSPSLMNLDEYKNKSLANNNDFIVKFLVLAILENCVLFLSRFFYYNYFPTWYGHLPLIKSLYLRRYYNRETETLPHKEVENKFQTVDEFLDVGATHLDKK